MNRVCLNMIVKDEAHVVERCLASVRPFVDTWTIVDTGSTDGTQDLVRHALRDLPGALHERPWRDFGHNRTEALELARGQGDYLFTIDADEVLQLPAGYRRPELSAPAYAIDIERSSLVYGRVCLVSAALPWRWIGVLHEYLDCGRQVITADLPDVRVTAYMDGARSRQGDVPKYSEDARLLERVLREEPDNARYVFYLAQSYRDSGQLEQALAQYDRRAGMGGWIEEAWFSRYSAALLAEKLRRDPEDVVRRYLQAYETRPERGGETLGQLARYCRERREYASGRLFAERALGIAPPGDRLFVDFSWYAWRCADEYAVACYWTGAFGETRRVCEKLLASPHLPEEERARVRANLEHALDRVRRPPASPT